MLSAGHKPVLFAGRAIDDGPGNGGVQRRGEQKDLTQRHGGTEKDIGFLCVSVSLCSPQVR